MKLTSLVLPLSLVALPAAAVTVVPLASTMNEEGFISDRDITGGISRISLGDGSASDLDGVYNVNDETQLFGSGINLYPNEGNFTVGSLTYDETDLTGSGTEVISIATLNLASLAASDIPAAARLGWFNAPTDFVFGTLDAADTVTFTNGVLSGINLGVTASFVLTTQQGSLSWDGSFGINGNAISLQINDTNTLPNPFNPTGPPIEDAPIVADFVGTVNAVPEPSSALLAGLALLLGVGRRSRK